MGKRLPNRPDQRDRPGLLLGLSLIAFLGTLLAACFVLGPAPHQNWPGVNELALGAYIATWGAMFLASYYYSHTNFFFRALIWVCENFSRPSGRKMAFFYFGLATILGILAIMGGLGVIDFHQ
jgi:hypothetical protein